MANPIQFKQSTTAENIPIGAPGEPTYSILEDRLYIGNGVSNTKIANMIDIKESIDELEEVARTGSYSDLMNVPDSFKPKSHKSPDVEYGIADNSNYGHVRLSALATNLNSTSSAGTPNGVVANADHVHNIPTAAQVGAAAMSHASSNPNTHGVATDILYGHAKASPSPASSLGAENFSGTPNGIFANADHVHRFPSAIEVGAAPVSHTSSVATTYGVATDSLYGHVRASSVAALPKNLGAASAGTPNGVVANADHVHPFPNISDLGAAPVSHASVTTIFGPSTETTYGHAKASPETVLPLPLGIPSGGTPGPVYANPDHVHRMPTASEVGAIQATEEITERVVTLKNCVGGISLNTTVRAVAIQVRSGEISPDNQRAIMAYNRANISHTGTNLCPALLGTSTSGGVTRSENPDKTQTFNGTSGTTGATFNILGTAISTEEVLPLSGKTVTISGGSPNVFFQLTYWDRTVFTTKRVSGDSLTFVIPDNHIVTRLSFGINGKVTVNSEVAYAQLEIGSNSTPYNPYIDTTYITDFPQPIYGLSRAPDEFRNNGIGLRRTQFLQLDGTETIALSSTSANHAGFRITPPKPIKLGAEQTSSHFKPTEKPMVEQVEYECLYRHQTAANIYIVIAKNRLETVDAVGFKTWLISQYTAGTPVQVLYELATPEQFVINPFTVTAFTGVNNIWSNIMGDTTVSYALNINLPEALDKISPSQVGIYHGRTMLNFSQPGLGAIFPGGSKNVFMPWGFTLPSIPVHVQLTSETSEGTAGLNYTIEGDTNGDINGITLRIRNNLETEWSFTGAVRWMVICNT